ncbi:MAG: glycosyltransferase [Treponema sp.]|nr:glycosyltransferase [Treponema sp.]
MLSGGLRSKGITKKSEKNAPLITIITVVFNGEKTLEDTILSVTSQDYKNIEYIVVDGNSKDATLDIIKKYEDKIDYWISESDKGIYDAMNKGIDLASGDWINFMNSGDSFCNNSVLSQVFSKNFENVSMIFGNTHKIYDFGEVDSTPIPAFPDKKNPMPFVHQSSFVNAKDAKEYHFNIQYRIAADLDLSYRLFNAGKKFEYVDVLISNYENSEGVSSVNPLKWYKDYLNIINPRFKKSRYVLKRLKTLLRKIVKSLIPAPLLKHYRRRRFIGK